MPEGFLVDAGWLSDNGFGREHLRDYLGRGFLERLDHDVYRRPSEGSRPGVVGWKACLLSLSHVMGRYVHIGGTTALAMHAFADQKYLNRNASKLLYGEDFPAWLVHLSLDTSFETRTSNLFPNPVLGIEDARDEQWLPWDWAIQISTPERAILEALDELPCNEDFHNLDGMFRRLVLLRTKLMAELLRVCRKPELKRLFFVFSDRYDHAWNEDIDPADFDLGTGDLAFMQDGKMHPRYGIIVPPPFAHTGERHR